MTYTTELLENESGIQYQGVKDKTGGTGTYSITGLMTGIFKRGRFDKPMTITNENIRAQLGYDPKNSYYVAVQDVLSSGVPSVQVLRLEGANTSIISCEGATNSVSFAVAMDQYGFDNIETEEIQNALQIILDGAVLDSYFEPSAVGLKLELSVETDVPFQIENGFVVQSILKYSNISDLPKRLEIKSATEHVKFYMWANPTVNQIDGNTRNHVGACLSAKSNCQPTTTFFSNGEPFTWGDNTIGIKYQINNESIKTTRYGSSGGVIDVYAADEFKRLLNNPNFGENSGNYELSDALNIYFDWTDNGNGHTYSGISGDGIDGTTIKLFPQTADDENYIDLFTKMFGDVDFIELHSCSSKQFTPVNCDGAIQGVNIQPTNPQVGFAELFLSKRITVEGDQINYSFETPPSMGATGQVSYLVEQGLQPSVIFTIENGFNFENIENKEVHVYIDHLNNDASFNDFTVGDFIKNEVNLGHNPSFNVTDEGLQFCLAPYVPPIEEVKSGIIEYTTGQNINNNFRITTQVKDKLTVDWGDGSIIDYYPNDVVEHEYAIGAATTYLINLTGNVIGQVKIWDGNTGSARVKEWGDLEATGWIIGMNCRELPLYIPTSFTDLTRMLDGRSNINIPEDTFRDWDVSNIISMRETFFNSQFINPNVTNWDVSNVRDMYGMFKFSGINRDLSNWNTSNVIDMTEMFHGASKFNQPLLNWNTSNVISMRRMFKLANNFNQRILFNTSNVTDMSEMFSEIYAFDQPLPFDTRNVTNMSGMFLGTYSFNQELSHFDVSNVIDMSSMFHGARAFDKNINNWDVSNVITMNRTFFDASPYSSNPCVYNQPLNNWNITNVLDVSSMFAGQRFFNQNLSNWSVYGKTQQGGMLVGCEAFEVGNRPQGAFF